MRMHHITGMPIEDGHGAHPEHIQVARHCDDIEKAGNLKRADEMRKELGIETSVEKAERIARAAQQEKAARDIVPTVQRHHERLTALEENAEEHEAMKERLTALEQAVAELKASKEQDHGGGE